jgi:hypothetical protein
VKNHPKTKHESFFGAQEKEKKLQKWCTSKSGSKHPILKLCGKRWYLKQSKNIYLKTPSGSPLKVLHLDY